MVVLTTSYSNRTINKLLNQTYHQFEKNNKIIEKHFAIWPMLITLEKQKKSALFGCTFNIIYKNQMLFIINFFKINIGNFIIIITF